MPYAPAHPCSVPGCDKRLPRGVRRCPAHAQQHEHQRRRDTPGRLVVGARGHLIDFYQSPQWYALKAQVLAEEPLCRMCKAEGKSRLTEHVDHIIPRVQGGPDTRENCQGLCATHHSEKTMREMRRSA